MSRKSSGRGVPIGRLARRKRRFMAIWAMIRPVETDVI
jgi:hypothetical protein